MTTISGVSSVLDASFVVDHRGLRNIAARTVLSAGGQALSLATETASGLWTTANFVTADSVDGASLSIIQSVKTCGGIHDLQFRHEYIQTFLQQIQWQRGGHNRNISSTSFVMKMFSLEFWPGR